MAKFLREIRQQGYEEGMSYGYWLGRCESVMRSMPFQESQYWPNRVLYVKSGKGLPYSPIDTAIISSLERMVQQLNVTVPGPRVARTAEACRPDLVLVFDGWNMPVEQVEELRKQGCMTAVWMADDPYYVDVTETFAVAYDFVFTLELNCVEFYKSIGCRQVFYLPLGVNPSVFRPRKIAHGQMRDIVFIGSGYWNRVRLFEGIAKFLASKNTHISGIWWKQRLRHARMPSKIANHWKSPAETALGYSGSKIAINVHRAHDDLTFNRNSRGIEAFSPNPRTFEIACSGTLQLTDARSDLVRFYESGAEIVTYDSANDLKDKIDYYLRHEDERREIALRALIRTLKEHTYMHRLQELLLIAIGPGVSAQ